MRSWAHQLFGRVVALASLGVAAGCGGADTAGGTTPALVTAARAIEAVLDDWHDAAAAADEARYFSHFTEDAVFLGTDANERWAREDFRVFAHPHFEEGRAWAFRSLRRSVTIAPGGDLAWFDEDLETDTIGPARGSGVLRLGEDGRWRIAHYNLAVTIPNDRFREVRQILESEPPAEASPSPPK